MRHSDPVRPKRLEALRASRYLSSPSSLSLPVRSSLPCIRVSSFAPLTLTGQFLRRARRKGQQLPTPEKDSLPVEGARLTHLLNSAAHCTSLSHHLNSEAHCPQPVRLPINWRLLNAQGSPAGRLPRRGSGSSPGDPPACRPTPYERRRPGAVHARPGGGGGPCGWGRPAPPGPCAEPRASRVTAGRVSGCGGAPQASAGTGRRGWRRSHTHTGLIEFCSGHSAVAPRTGIGPI